MGMGVKDCLSSDSCNSTPVRSHILQLRRHPFVFALFASSTILSDQPLHTPFRSMASITLVSDISADDLL